jgi:hypothetical protein
MRDQKPSFELKMGQKHRALSTGLHLGGLIATFVLAARVQGQAVAAEAEMLAGLALNVGVLGFALGLGSVLCGYRPREMAMFGLVTRHCLPGRL